MSQPDVTDFPSDLQLPPQDGAAPRPFTGEMIRTGMPVGAERRYVTEGPAGTRSTVVWTVVRTSRRGCTIRFTFLEEDGSPAAASTERTTAWHDLAAHATFPITATKVVSQSVQVPAGTFECWEYTVTERSDQDILVSTYSFAKQLPGAPVRYAGLRNGTSEGVTYLESYSQPT
ncbi:MAG: hypothetical protein GVY29_10950 [Spirochaetes bacterium]|jgi:hypothetical protein|nr:hypothetical protein [Spirochaetota bacterium]